MTALPQGFHPIPFTPRRFLSNGHLQTILGVYLPRHDSLPPPEPELVEVSPASGSQLIATQVLCHNHWQPEAVRASRSTAIIMHGLEGSSSSQYVIGNANKLWQAGFNIVRMNMRNCGGTEHLSSTLYHSGLSGDIEAVMRHVLRTRELQSIVLIGYSMGGNMVLKLAGDLGRAAPPELHAVVGVSPAVDLGTSADELHRPVNRLYERNFLKALLRRFRRKAALFPHAFDPARGDDIHSIRDFDDRITALYSGFANADDYYYRAAAARVLDRITVPSLILHATDDPFVRITPATCATIAANKCITYIETAHGGHCAFLATPSPTPLLPGVPADGYWAEAVILRFALAHCHQR